MIKNNSDFYFTAASWFPGNVRIKSHSTHSTEMRFVHFLSDFFKAGILGQDIQNPNKVWKVTCKIARVFAEICRFYQKRSLKWPHFARNVAPFFPTKMIFFQTKMGFWNFYRNKYGYLKPVLKNLIAGLFKSVKKSTKNWKL